MEELKRQYESKVQNDQ